MQRSLAIAVAAVASWLAVGACRGDCSSPSVPFGASEPPANSAEALEGVYGVTEVREARRGCANGEWTAVDSQGVIRVDRAGGGERERPGGGDGGPPGGSGRPGDGKSGPVARETRLRVEWCRDAGCEEVRWEGVLTRGDEGGWAHARGFGSLEERVISDRRCRLRVRRVRLAAAEGGVRFERTVRESVAALEGEERCSGELAVENRRRLDCERRRRVAAE